MTDSPLLGRRLRLGMVGGGQGAFIGGVHRIAARIDDKYELVAGALSSDAERARASAAEVNIAADRSYDSYDDMAKAESARDDGIDVVAIVTPNHVHHGPAKAFLAAGIHVICDKPLTTTLDEANDLADTVARTGLLFGVTHNYTGYPMVRQARDMVASGALGKIRVVQAEYPQDWLTNKFEDTGNKQAEWRTDPARSGPAGSVGDIGTHAHNLARFITGLEVNEIATDLDIFVEGRQLEDNAHMLLRFDGGAKGMLWSSQIAVGNENNLRIRVYGDQGGLEWSQEHPNQLRFTPFGEEPRIISRGAAGTNAATEALIRIPAGHPEGYLEAFAQLYTDMAEQITARLQGRDADANALLVPTINDGVMGVRFIAAAVASSADGGRWTAI
jgi:predicted dehydrogenase